MKIMEWIEKISRRIDVRYRLVVIFTLIIAGVTGIMGIYATSVVSDRLVTAAEEKLLSDLKMGEYIIDQAYPGEWKIENGLLYKGDNVING